MKGRSRTREKKSIRQSRDKRKNQEKGGEFINKKFWKA